MHRSLIAPRGLSPRLALAAAAVLALAVLLSILQSFAAPPAHAEGPGEGTPWVVSLGDSYISGEAGRWAGNSNESPSWVDALGESAYYDNSGSHR